MGVKCSRCGSTDPQHIQSILSPAGMECARPIPADLIAVRDQPEAGWPEQRHRLGTVIAAFTNRLDHEFVAMGLPMTDTRAKVGRILLDVINSLPSEAKAPACCTSPPEAHVGPPFDPAPRESPTRGMPEPFQTVIDAFTNRIDYQLRSLGCAQDEARDTTDQIVRDVVKFLRDHKIVRPAENGLLDAPKDMQSSLQGALRYLGAKWRRRTRLGLTEAAKDIAQLADKRDLVGSAAVLANALALYEVLSKEASAGSTVILRLKDNGGEAVLDLRYLEGRA